MDNRRPPLWWELPVALGAYLGCTALSAASLGPVVGGSGDKAAAARANARQVLALERHLRLAVETSANRWLAGRTFVTVIAGYHYAAVYILTSIAVLVFLYLRSPRLYRWARRSAILLNVIAALCFAVFPVAPPRLNPELSISDAVFNLHIWGTWGSQVADGMNQLAALPSLHFAWVLWVLWALVKATRSVVLITLASADVILTAVVVVATGNHYPLDLFAATVLVAVSVALTRPWSPELRSATVARLGRLGAILRRRAVLTDD
jgi:hypothetical protein